MILLKSCLQNGYIVIFFKFKVKCFIFYFKYPENKFVQKNILMIWHHYVMTITNK